MGTNYYTGDNASMYVPFKKLTAFQWYYYPNFLTINWDKVSRREVNENISSLKSTEGSMNEKIQIYIHIPFCNEFCHYCPFTKNHYPRQNKDIMSQYIDYVIKELDFYLDQPYVQSKPISSLTIGGGSPSVLSLKDIERLFNHFRKVLPTYDSLEKTFTGEPRSLRSNEQLELLKDVGCNRITFGIETLNEKIRRDIGRHDTQEDIDSVFTGLEKLNFKGDVCVDILYNLPGQSFDDFKNDIQTLVKQYKPPTIDSYSIVYSPTFPLWRLIAMGKRKQPAPIWDLLKMREFIHNYLTEEGYNNVLSETYSQFDKPSSYHEGRCNHEDIIPVGVASQGSFKDMRTVNPSSIDLWMKNIQQYGVSTQTLQSVGRNGEFLRNMVMFPRYKKISKKYIQSFRDVKDYNRIIKIIKKHIDLSLVEEHENYYSVTDLGVIWYGNLQRDYVNHQLNLKGKIGLNMVSYPKKHFDRKDRIDMNPIAKLFYKVGKDKESGRSLND